MLSILPKGINEDPVYAAFSLANFNEVSSGAVGGLNLGFNSTDASTTVNNNRKIWFDLLGLDVGALAMGKQVHGNNVEIVQKPGLWDFTDGLVTKKKDIILAVLVADCAAILMADKTAGVIAAIHAGWRGAVAGIHKIAVNKMSQIGANSDHISAWISPCLSVESFEVGDEVASQFPPDVVIRGVYKKPHIDLKKFLIGELEKSGLKKDRISTDERCTLINSDSFYSYRRQKDNSGRMMALITLK